MYSIREHRRTKPTGALLPLERFLRAIERIIPRRCAGERWVLQAVHRRLIWFAYLLAGVCLAGLTATGTAEAQWSMLRQDVTLAADDLTAWKDGHTRYFLFQGNCFAEQGIRRVRADQILAWIDESPSTNRPTRIDFIPSGNIRIEGNNPDDKTNEYITFETSSKLKIESKDRHNASGASSPLFAKAQQIIAANTTSQKPSGTDDAPTEVAIEDMGIRRAGRVPFGSLTPQDSRRKTEYVDDQVIPAVAGSNTSGASAVEPAIGSAGGQVVGGSGGSETQLVQYQATQMDPSAVDTNNNGATVSSANVPAVGNSAQGFAGALSPSARSTSVRRVRAFPRSSQPFHSDSFRTADGLQVFVFTGGINLIVEELDSGNVIDVAADRIVLWTRGNLLGQFGGGGAEAEGEQPLEFYLEGNVTIRQGNPRDIAGVQTTVLQGKQVYFNVNRKQALLVDGGVETFDATLGVPVFMRGDEIYQLTPKKFYAEEASFTTSPYRGTPGYEFTSNGLVFEEVTQDITNPFTGQPVIDTQTGQPLKKNRYFATGYSNILRVSDFPVFYLPYVKADVEDPLGPLETINVGSSSNLGTYGSAIFDGWQLFGLDYLPITDQTNWWLDLGYYSDRGIAGGTRFNYLGDELFGLKGPMYGNMLTWWIADHGVDNLGADRRALVPPRELRGRYRQQHHQKFSNGMTFIGEVSFLSDENFLESFYEAEYDSGADQNTLAYLKQQEGIWAWSALLQPRINAFLPQNSWYPRLDGYVLGKSFLDNRLTYSSHSSLAFGQVLPPTQDQLVTDLQVDAGRFDTRHEVDLPLSMGALHFTPYAVGQFTGYTATSAVQLTDDPVNGLTETGVTGEGGLGRLYAAGGFRASVPFWKVYPGVQSSMLNIDGLAHRVVPYAEYLYAYSNRSYLDLPQMDQIDDDTSDLVRRQNLIRTFGGVVPLSFDPRYYALRRNVTTDPDILDSMQNFQLGIAQTLQTKRGPVGEQRIIDWMYLDLSTTFFPEADRDNFGEPLGFVDGSYFWRIGDRTSFNMDTRYQPNNETYQINGVLSLQRPPRTSLSIFTSYFESGPYSSTYMGGSMSYRFSPKYAGYISTGTDFQSNNTLSYTLGFTRIGLDFIANLGIVLNQGRDDLGLQFEILPRIQAASQLSRTTLLSLPFGLEPGVTPAPLSNDRLSVINPSY